MNKNIEMIQIVAQAFKNFEESVVFVGGATVSLYLNLDVAEEVRPTEDVDVIVEITSTIEYSKLSEKLLKLKFNPDTSKGAPICRWKYLGITVDIMPVDKNILGFSNIYYKDAFNVYKTVNLPNGGSINILPLPYFLLTKLEAFQNRGIDDPRFSKDLEDIIAILNNGKDLGEIDLYPEIKDQLISKLKALFENKSCLEAIRGFLSSSEELDILRGRLKISTD